MKEVDIKSSWARGAAVKLARKLYGRRIDDSVRIIKTLLEEKEFFGGTAVCPTFRELLQKTGLSEWKLRRAIDFLISIEVIRRKHRTLYCMVVKPSFLSSTDLELFLAARAAFKLTGDEDEDEKGDEERGKRGRWKVKGKVKER